MIVGGYSATGPREANEDSYFARTFAEVDSFTNGVNTFLAVSDGMGGYQGGDVASGLVVKNAEQYLDDLLEIARNNTIEFDPDVALREIVQASQESIENEIAARGGVASMGATFVGAFVSPTHAWIGHVGDSRAYLIRQGEVTQLTEDHSQVGRMLSQGLLTEEEAQNHPARNRIERALGFVDHEMELTEVELMPGDGLLLVSDGVYTVLNTNVLARICDHGNPEAVAGTVVKEALRRGTDDNSTAVVGLDESAMPTRKMRRAAPTMRLQHVGGDTQQGRVLRSSDMKEAAPRRRRSALTYLPLALAFVLIGVAIGMFFMAMNQGAQAGSAPEAAASPAQTAGSEGSAEESAGSEGEGTAQSTDDAASSGQSVATTPNAKANYNVAQGAVVRYVDADGLAWRFTEDQLALSVDPSFSMASSVTANQETSDFGRPGFTYRMMDDSYLQDLLNDCKLYEQGITEFSSALSRLIDPQSYQTLLAGINSKPNASATVCHLVLNASDTGSSAGSTESSAQTESSLGTGNAESEDHTGTSDGTQGTGFSQDGTTGYDQQGDPESSQGGGMDPSGRHGGGGPYTR